MFLFFEGFQPKNVLVLFLISMKHSYLLMLPAAADLGFNFKGCATSDKAASINGTRGLGGVVSPRSQCIQSYLQPKTRLKWQRQLSSARFA